MDINNLIKYKIITPKDGMYKCRCGVIIQENEIKEHLLTLRHQYNTLGIFPTKDEEEFIQMKVSTIRNPETYEYLTECTICTDVKETFEFFICDRCNNEHCIECSSKLERCPFCRGIFDDLIEPVKSYDEELLNQALSLLFAGYSNITLTSEEFDMFISEYQN